MCDEEMRECTDEMEESTENGNNPTKREPQEPEDTEPEFVTMLDVLEEEEKLEEDANAVLGASDEKNCTYSKGYMQRQALYACMTCCGEARNEITKRAGVCLACSYHCHEGHELIELYTKRNFRCDCGNFKFGSSACNLEPHKEPVNELNRYNHNFSGLYCTCQRPYPDPEDSIPDDMIQCIVCEDWYHCRHLNGGAPNDQLPYAEMTCGTCVGKHSFLLDYAQEIIRKIEPANQETSINVTDDINDSEATNFNQESSKVNRENSETNHETSEINQESPKSSHESPKSNHESPKSNHESNGDASEFSHDAENEESSEFNQEEASEFNQEGSELKQEVSEGNEAFEFNQESSEFNQDTSKFNREGSESNDEDPEFTQDTSEFNADSSTFNYETSGCNREISEANDDVSESNHEPQISSEVSNEPHITSSERELDNDPAVFSSDHEVSKEPQMYSDNNLNNELQVTSGEDEILNIKQEVPNTNHEDAENKNGSEQNTPIDNLVPTITTEEASDDDIKKEATSSEMTESNSEKACVRPASKSRPSGGDNPALFWPEGWRNRLCACTNCSLLYEKQDVAFLPDINDTVHSYEQRGRNVAPATSYEQGMQVLSAMERTAQLEAISHYNHMKEELKDYLQTFARAKRIVREEDIRDFFSRMSAKRPRLEIPYTCR